MTSEVAVVCPPLETTHMPILIALRHLTEYRYDRQVELLPHVVRLRPAPHCRTPILGYSLKVEPSNHFINWQQDPYSNHLARLVFPKKSDNLRIEVELLAELRAFNPFDFFIDPSFEQYPFVYEPTLSRELSPYLEAGDRGPLLNKVLSTLRRERVRTIDYLVEINQFLQQLVRYLIRMEPGIQTCEETLQSSSGSCRDSAWLMVQILRGLGIAARFTSGYLIQLVPDEKPVDGPSGPPADFTDLHAWAEAYLPGAGWIGLDPTSGLMAGEGHIPLACSADPITAAAISGSYLWDRLPGEGEDARATEELTFQMAVTRFDESPRSTKPYTDAEWKAIDTLGHKIDAELELADVRLTLGGEPTFVSTKNRDAPEWNTAALGDEKRRIADELLRRLQARIAPGGLLFHGMGKWYPGEPIPRWGYGCYWRKDGDPIWRDVELFAVEGRGGHCGESEARQFIRRLAERLELDPSSPIAAHEDAWYYLWRERCLPINVDPFESRLEDPEERKRLQRVFDQGLRAVVGYVMPLRREVASSGSRRWQSGQWTLREKRLYLLPGDSPMGFRLPLDALHWEAQERIHQVLERDPLEPRTDLPRYPCRDTETFGQPRVIAQAPPGMATFSAARAAGGNQPIVRTALCVEPRGGILHIFLPPVSLVEDCLDLLARIEETAHDLSLPVRIEGYAPPYDPRLQHLQITPDPGVLEVNVHPSGSWSELVKNTSVLHEEARQLHLTAEKFLLDGRPTGTGGGNHILLGGPTPQDSPILRRPDLLRSLIAYWQNHPALSYLFSSVFIGPTSQAPRVDEARNDSLYELDIAFRQLSNGSVDQGSSPPWIVDRLFRNLLVDVTGNTHRAEFCIDKLYSPETASGRRGLLEMRSFEMAPHERMSLSTQLLVRALVAWFWRTPYRQPLVRWGTQIHDRFMLPHFLQQDLEEVVEDLRRAGHMVDPAWFRPHLEFRFPQIGSVTCQGVHLELRPALEPWPVLGEEPGGGGQVRFVDSSVERLQVMIEGLTEKRHVVTCNGRRVPLHPTGATGEFVAGVRFRAWQPPACLHPRIPVHAPLVFDLVDAWQERAIGGCTYHVVHPGGRAFDTLPINSLEAESRWRARFWPLGHSIGTVPVPPEERQVEYPMTLDLRRPESACLKVPAG